MKCNCIYQNEMIRERVALFYIYTRLFSIRLNGSELGSHVHFCLQIVVKHCFSGSAHSLAWHTHVCGRGEHFSAFSGIVNILWYYTKTQQAVVCFKASCNVGSEAGSETTSFCATLGCFSLFCALDHSSPARDFMMSWFPELCRSPDADTRRHAAADLLSHFFSLAGVSVEKPSGSLWWIHVFKILTFTCKFKFYHWQQMLSFFTLTG